MTNPKAAEIIETPSFQEKKTARSPKSMYDNGVWHSLYELADAIDSLKPWNAFSFDMPVFIFLDGEEFPVVVSFEQLGQGRNGRSLIIYQGEKSLCDYDILYIRDRIVPREYTVYDRDAWSVTWTSSQRVSQAQKEIIKSLGRNYRGEGNWPSFHTLQSRFAPSIPNKKDAVKIVLALKELYAALADHLDEKVKVDYDADQCLARRYDDEKKCRITCAIPYQEPTMSFKSYGFNDEVMRRRLKNKKANASIINIDFFYNGWTPLGKMDDFEAVPNLLFLLAVDETDGSIVAISPIAPQIELGEAALHVVHDYVIENGRMKEIIVRNTEVYAALETICEDIGVALTMDSLPCVDRLLNEIRSGV